MNSLLCVNHTSAHMQGAGSQSISHLSTASSAERMDSEKIKTAPAAEPPVPAPRMDEYIPEGERACDAPGLYQIVPDEDGRRSIAFDEFSQTGAHKAKHSDPAGENGEAAGEGIREMKQHERKAAPDAPNAPDGPDADEPRKQTCTTDTDKVDAEIRRLREKLEKLQQQLSGTGNQPQEQRRLEQQIAQVQQELQAKDTDSYRRQQAEYRMG